MRFIKVELIGGLGNQLFQYAMARSTMKEYDILMFDAGSYKNDYLNRHFTLDKYKVKGKIVEKTNLERFFNRHSKINHFIKNLGLFTDIHEKGFYVHNNIKSDLRMFTSLYGYWQSYKYFKTIREQLQQEITLKTLPERLPEFLKKNETTVVHIRRTDYLNDARYGAIEKNYYLEAMNKIKSLIDNPSFVFFSDDIEWCKQNFQEGNISFCEHLPDYIRLYLMTLCRHHIISNSSFAWWGAWLCANPNQVVVRPENPFKDSSLLYEHYYPENWISVSNN